MKVSIRVGLLAVFALVTISTVLADVPNPNSNRPRNSTRSGSTPMSIRPEPEAKEATLLIPKNMLQRLAASTGESDETVATAGVTRNLTNTQTLVAGTFLSLSIVLGGFWLVRKQPATGSIARAAGVVLFAALVGVASGVAFGNAGPPPVARSLTTKILSPEVQLWGATGSVRIQVADSESRITLVLPKPADEAK